MPEELALEPAPGQGPCFLSWEVFEVTAVPLTVEYLNGGYPSEQRE